MKIARIEYNGRKSHAVVEHDGFHPIEGTVFGEWRAADSAVPEAEAKLLAPVDPLQIVAIGLNYQRHAVESGFPLPELPLIFVKTSNTIVGPGDPVLLPKMAPGEVDFECELVIVIGKEAKNVDEGDVSDYVLGYTCGNDVSARDCQLKIDKQWARGKCFDSFAPIGPWIETELDADNVDIGLKLDGEVMQSSNTSDMVFSCPQLVSFVSQCMTLAPGSIIMTGTPEGVGLSRDPQVYLKAGQTMTVEIGGIGALTNPVVLES
jgi:2-keto-4-pentenoate hydratase/2-oxohepta-3-ene-1,7-dioic acid hydratase in catechol pathway